MVDEIATDTVQTDTGNTGNVSQPPATEPPATEPPATEPPATEPPATEPPADNDIGDGIVENQSTDETTYADFEMKDGFQLDADALATARPLFKELGLDQVGAQKAVDIYSDLVQAGAKKQVDAFNEQIATWREDSKNDSEFGGESFDENVKLAQAAVNKLGTPELKQLLEDYGVGNHPEIIRFMVRVGKLTAEDVPGNEAGATGGNADRVSVLYPNARNS